MPPKQVKQSKKKPQIGSPPAQQSLARNKRATSNYEIIDKKEAGIVLTGGEVKSVRYGHVSIREAYARFIKDELYLVGAHIPPYQPNQKLLEKYVPTRMRKLLLHKSEINRLYGKSSERGLTLVPLEIYIKKNRVKILLGIGRGRKKYEKKEEIKKREDTRRLQRAFKQ